MAICTIVIWLSVWAALHARWRGKRLQNEHLLMAATFMLVLIALIATFPPFYGLLAKGG